MFGNCKKITCLVLFGNCTKQVTFCEEGEQLQHLTPIVVSLIDVAFLRLVLGSQREPEQRSSEVALSVSVHLCKPRVAVRQTNPRLLTQTCGQKEIHCWVANITDAVKGMKRNSEGLLTLHPKTFSNGLNWSGSFLSSVLFFFMSSRIPGLVRSFIPATKRRDAGMWKTR